MISKIIEIFQDLENRSSLSKKALKNCDKCKGSHIIFFFLLYFLIPVAKSLDDKPNLIVNGNFSQPEISTLSYAFNVSIPGWNCSQRCKIKNCQMALDYWIPRHVVDSDCKGQVINLSANVFNESVTQNIQLNSLQYRLHFNYYYPNKDAALKVLEVKFNEKTLLYHRPLVYASFDSFEFTQIVIASQGINTLTFTKYSSIADGTGFKINNVSLYRIDDKVLQTVLQAFVDNRKVANSLPGGRIVFGSILSFMMNFDRLELYIYHNRIYSYNQQQFLVSINSLLNAKSDLTIKMFRYISGRTVEMEQQFTNSTNFKESYISYSSFSENYKNMGYFQNLNQQFIYFFPLVIFLVVLLNLLFSLLFHSPVSLLFRKFSLWAIIFIMLFDGNIENLTFFTFAQFKAFFSFCPYHKILNIIVLLLFFAVLFTVFGLILWGRFHYKNRIKYLTEESAARQTALWGIMVDRGIVCVLFGMAHQMLITCPGFQILVLIVLEFSWTCKKALWLYKGLNNQKCTTVIAMSLINGICRVFLQITSIIYQNQEEKRLYLNENIHKWAIFCLVGTAVLQMLFALICGVRSVFKISKKGLSQKVHTYTQANIPIVLANKGNTVDKAKILRFSSLKDKIRVDSTFQEDVPKQIGILKINYQKRRAKLQNKFKKMKFCVRYQ